MKIETLAESLKNRGLRQCLKQEDKDADIWVFETDLETDKPDEYPWGYYQLFWVVGHKESKGECDVGRIVELEAMHDAHMSMNPDQKRQSRINAALKDAREYIADNFRSGRLH